MTVARALRPWTLLLLAGAAAGCAERLRPGPAETTLELSLAVNLLSPRTSDVVFAGRSIPVRVQASESAGRLIGVGFVARRFQNNARVDSVVIVFPERRDTTHIFELRVPADFPHNAQIDVYGLAFGSRAAPRVSTPRAIVVVSCAQNNACP